MESAYQFDKERQLFEAEQQKKDLAIENQRTIIVTLAVAVVFMLLLALSLYRWYRLKRRTNRAILQQRAQIEKLQQLEIDRMNEELEANQKAMTAAELKLVQNSERDAQTIKALEEKQKHGLGRWRERKPSHQLDHCKGRLRHECRGLGLYRAFYLGRNNKNGNAYRTA